MFKRHYKISLVDENSCWIFLSCDEYDIEEPDSFVELVKRIAKNISGKIIDLGDIRYRIEGEELNLIFQWDSCFGMVVEYSDNVSKEKVVQFLKIVCD